MTLSLSQKIAIKWYQTIDSTGLIYQMLKELNIYIRAAFYIGLPVFIYFVMNYIGSILPLAKYSLEQFYSLIVILTALGASLVVTYESLYGTDLKAILAAKKAEKLRVINEKEQFWRLRNMSFLSRAILYFVIYFIITTLLQFVVTASFLEHFKNPTVADIKALEESYGYMLSWISMGFVTVFLSLEYFVQKKISSKKETKCLK